jgi:hypothetical protein
MNDGDIVFEKVILNVSDLAAPEPMTKIIQALVKLTTQQFLLVDHRREPFPLFEKLTSAGWLYSCQQQAPECYKIYIFKVHQHQFVTQLSSIRADTNL